MQNTKDTLPPSRLHGPYQNAFRPFVQPRHTLGQIVESLNSHSRWLPLGLLKQYGIDPASIADYDLASQKLNITKERRLLRRLVHEWDKCDRDLRKLFERRPILKKHLERGETKLVANIFGRPYLDWKCPDIVGSPRWKSALEYFADLLISPDSDYLDGPCKRCEQYFIRKRQRTAQNDKSVYCSRVCSGKTTSRDAAKKNSEQVKAETIMRVEKAIHALKLLTRQPYDPAETVRKGAAVTKTMLTRLMNDGYVEDVRLVSKRSACAIEYSHDLERDKHR